MCYIYSLIYSFTISVCLFSSCTIILCVFYYIDDVNALSATGAHFKWELMLYCLHYPTLNQVFLLLLLLLLTNVALVTLTPGRHIAISVQQHSDIIIAVTTVHHDSQCLQQNMIPNRSSPTNHWQTHMIRNGDGLFLDRCTVKPVCNDHLYNKTFYLWFIQWCVIMKTEGINLLLLTISAFWS